MSAANLNNYNLVDITATMWRSTLRLQVLITAMQMLNISHAHAASVTHSMCHSLVGSSKKKDMRVPLSDSHAQQRVRRPDR